LTSDGNNLNDFPENQFAKFFHCITVSPSPDIIYRKNVPQKIFARLAFLLDYTTACCRLEMGCCLKLPAFRQSCSMRGLNFVVLLFFQQVFVFAYEDPSLLIDNI